MRKEIVETLGQLYKERDKLQAEINLKIYMLEKQRQHLDDIMQEKVGLENQLSKIGSSIYDAEQEAGRIFNE